MPENSAIAKHEGDVVYVVLSSLNTRLKIDEISLVFRVAERHTVLNIGCLTLAEAEMS